jgi:sulfide:quinone oxidoreductase
MSKENLISDTALNDPATIEGLKNLIAKSVGSQPSLFFASDLPELSTASTARIGGVAIIPQTPNVPHQCGIAPIETTLMLDEYLTKRGVRDRVEIIYSYPTVSTFIILCFRFTRIKYCINCANRWCCH